ncbi:diacylglycerol/lipid kinase family protein [Sediminitomix flava]|uniref:YegS/Rv2252/BmrU family lipid kinase n=1 Tax=Sediminitomix flava TaxID=379075 RepID=A0A315ZYE0_SEDFL|nr:diacylglycerol kinase family protein [Sediminitomix flava]PWJ42377.1 YegS/Rv2252/BmrU family lipid kinase [Sediminitomix flava]
MTLYTKHDVLIHKTLANVKFIINPISGSGKGKRTAELIREKFNSPNTSSEILFTKGRDHAYSLAKELIEEGETSLIVAVGGDGTINEVASAMIGQNIPLGIIPIGSGNGLARHLNIPLNPQKAINSLYNAQTSFIDVGIVNGKQFFCTSGTGFDAYVSHHFAEADGRGLINYIKTGVQDYFNYKANKYKIEVDGKDYNVDAYMVSVANASQFGNNAYIAPNADISDGLLDVVIIKKFNKLNILPLVFKVFSKSLNSYDQVMMLRGANIKISTSSKQNKIYLHRDGEPEWGEENLTYSIKNNALKIFV